MRISPSLTGASDTRLTPVTTVSLWIGTVYFLDQQVCGLPARDRKVLMTKNESGN